MGFTIFYSWQSDLRSSANRKFIETALKSVAEELQRDATISVEPRVDHSTLGVPGSPEIVPTVFGKIDECQLFVADVSIINQDCEGRKTPNPNVLVELGYALKSLGPERILLVMNTFFGIPEEIPFDLRQRRMVTYSTPTESKDRSVERRRFQVQLTRAITAVIGHHELVLVPPPVTDQSLLDHVYEAIGGSSPQEAAIVGNFMSDLAGRLDQFAPDYVAADWEGVPLDEALVGSLGQTTALIGKFTRLAQTIANRNATVAARAVYEGFRFFLERYVLPERQPEDKATNFNAYQFDYYMFLGHELFVTFFAYLIRDRRWDIIGELLSESIYVESDRGGTSTSQRYYTISQNVSLFDARNSRLRSTRISLHADLLHDRHMSGELAELMPMGLFVEADYFLWLRSVVEAEATSDRTWWLAFSVIYLFPRTPTYFLDARRTDRAMEIAKALGLRDIGLMRSRIRERTGQVRELFKSFSGQESLRDFDVESLGSE